MSPLSEAHRAAISRGMTGKSRLQAISPERQVSLVDRATEIYRQERVCCCTLEEFTDWASASSAPTHDVRLSLACYCDEGEAVWCRARLAEGRCKWAAEIPHGEPGRGEKKRPPSRGAIGGGL